MTPDPHPLAAVLARFLADTNRMWAEGRITDGSTVLDVAPDLVAVQYAPHFPGGVWRADSGEAWVRGTAEAAAALHGQGCSWSLHDLVVLPRSGDEAAASYRVVHDWGSTGRRPAQALFLETWRRGPDGTWRLVRHTAEKA